MAANCQYIKKKFSCKFIGLSSPGTLPDIFLDILGHSMRPPKIKAVVAKITLAAPVPLVNRGFVLLSRENYNYLFKDIVWFINTGAREPTAKDGWRKVGAKEEEGYVG